MYHTQTQVSMQTALLMLPITVHILALFFIKNAEELCLFVLLRVDDEK